MGLPLRMSNLHAPTVPSGPTTAPSTNGNAARALSFAELQREKDNMEAELRALSGVLSSHGVDMHTSLLTPDGFPRSDIDVAQIRTTRARIIHLRNDYKNLMALVEKHLHEHFASLENEDVPAADPADQGSTLRDYIPDVLEEPFARVDRVTEGGPGDQGGLKVGDQIRRFGYVNHANHDNLLKVAECVQLNDDGQGILIKVARRTETGNLQELTLTISPSRNWGGRGRLGFHILPM